MMIKCWILCVFYFVTCSKARIVPWIKPCPLLDSQCIMKSADIALPYISNGVPELGLPAIDPLVLKDIRADSGEIKLGFRNVTVHQLSKCKFESITRDPVKSTARMVTICPSVLKGEYSIKGKLSFLEIYGDGPFLFEGGTIRTTVDLKIKSFTDKEGIKHYKVASFDYTFEPLTKYNIDFENLYDGDKAKAAPIVELVDLSWKEMIVTLGKPIMEECISSIVTIIDKLFKIMPAEEMEIV